MLAYFQNAIEDPWQKIPSVIAVFIAEASVILLDPSHDHYAAISKIVEKASQTKLSKINLEVLITECDLRIAVLLFSFFYVIILS